MLKFLSIILLVSTIICSASTVIDVRDYGAEINDDIDDYYAIQRAINALDQTKNGILVFHKGVYNINQHKIDNNHAVQKTVSTIYQSKPHNTKSKEMLKIIYLNESEYNTKYKSKNNIRNFTFTNYSNLTIKGNEAIFNFDGDWTRTADYTISSNKHTYSRHNAIGIEIINSQNVLIRDLELNGNADETVKEATAEGFSDGIMIGGSSLVTIDNVYVHHYHADGLYIYAKKDSNGIKRKSEHIQVSNSIFKNNARQGCSMVGARYVDFDNCSFSNTGDTGLYGFHNPMAGVDIEPHDINHMGDITFTKCNFVDNLGFAYVGSNSSTTPYPIAFKYCTFTNSKNTIWHQAVVPNSHKTNFSYCFFNEISLWPNYAAKNKKGYVNVNVSRCRFKSKNIEQKVLLANDSENLKWYIEKSSFELNSKHANSFNSKNRFYLKNNKQVVFQSNTIKMIKEEYQTYTIKPNIKFILDGVSIYATKWIEKLTEETNMTNSVYTIMDYSNGIIIVSKK